MINKSLYIFSVFLLACCTNMHAQNVVQNKRHKEIHKVSFGIKGGFNSTMMFINKISYGNQKINDIENNYKIGYTATVFTRINIKKRHFIQPEISYTISNSSISISNLNSNAATLKDNALIKTKMASINIPLLYGYKFINSYPYGMSFFLGPKVSFTIDKQSECKYSGFYQENIKETIQPINYGAVLGIGVNISNIFFDFRYEIGCNNITKSVEYDKISTSEPHNEKELTIKRHKNVLGFSVGFIF